MKNLCDARANNLVIINLNFYILAYVLNTKEALAFSSFEDGGPYAQARPWGVQAAQPSWASKTYGPQKNKLSLIPHLT